MLSLTGNNELISGIAHLDMKPSKQQLDPLWISGWQRRYSRLSRYECTTLGGAGC